MITVGEVWANLMLVAGSSGSVKAFVKIAGPWIPEVEFKVAALGASVGRDSRLASESMMTFSWSVWLRFLVSMV